MITTRDIEPGELIDLTAEVVGLRRDDGSAQLVMSDRPGPRRIAGLTIGAPCLSADPPHRGEVHPDGDELLFLVSGAVTVRLELPDGDRTLDMAAGQALVVPRGVWHLITLREPGQLVHITPGPGGDHRPLGPQRA